MQATAKDLRFHSKELLGVVARGEEVVITYRGKPCAKLVPFENNHNDVADETPLFGIWKDYDSTEDVENYINNLRKGRF